MKRPSSQSQGYLRAYRRWLRLLPAAFRDHYNQEMILLLQEQLTDAERSGDSSMVRETYLGALGELPLVALQEWALAPLDLKSLLEQQRMSEWRFFSYWYFTLIALIISCTMAYHLSLLNIVFVPLAALSLIWITWRFTGRLSLAGLVVLIGLIGVGLNYAGFGYAWISIDADYQIKLYGIIIPVLVIFLPPYLMSGWFHWRSEHYSRVALAGLSDEELATLSRNNARKRKISIRLASLIGLMILIPNLIGLYDPYRDTSFIHPGDHTVAHAQNAYYALEAISLPPSIGYPDGTELDGADFKEPARSVGAYLAGTAWDDAQVQRILRASAPARSQFAAAAALGGYQAPGLETARWFNAMSSAPYPQMSDYRIFADLTLLQGMAYAKEGNMDQALDQAQIVLRLTALLDQANQYSSGHAVTVSLQDHAVTFLSSITQSLTPEQRHRVAAMLPTSQEVWDGTTRGLKWEATIRIAAIPDRVGDINGYASALFLVPPYLYQPNRSRYAMASSMKALIDREDTACATALSSPPSVPRFSLQPFLQFNGVGNELSATGSYRFTRECSLLGKIESVQQRTL